MLSVILLPIIKDDFYQTNITIVIITKDNISRVTDYSNKQLIIPFSEVEITAIAFWFVTLLSVKVSLKLQNKFILILNTCKLELCSKFVTQILSPNFVCS